MAELLIMPVATSASESMPEITNAPFSIVAGTPNFPSLVGKSPKRSLGSVAEDCFGSAEPKTIFRGTKRAVDLEFAMSQVFFYGDIDTAIIQALTNWYRLQHVVASDIADRLLSWNHRNSYQLLYDWWMAAFQDPLKSLKELNRFIQLSETLTNELKDQTTMDANHGDLLACINRHKKALTLDGTPDTQMEDNINISYNRAMRRLFIYEFLTPHILPMDNMSHIQLLDDARGTAASEAYFLQVAAHRFRPPLLTVSVHKLSEEKGPCPWVCSAEASDLSYPRTIERGPLVRACPWLDPTTSTSAQNPYLGNNNTDGLDGWPKYLWDIERRCTICTKDSAEKRPAYIAISHTWGRWQRKDDRVMIEGGLRLPIPQNEKFNVRELPDMLTRLKSRGTNISANYVWLDLLCIPQVPADKVQSPEMKNWVEDQKEEIARQASIFRNAQTAIAWLHDIEDLSCLRALCEFFCLKKHLEDVKDSVNKEHEDLEEILNKAAVGGTGLLGGNIETPAPSDWFTSLWTLQEVCLRPDMWFATSNWSILTIGQNKPVPLSGLLVIIIRGTAVKVDKVEKRIIPALSEFSFWKKVTGLSQLAEFSMIDILRLGDRRYCQERRAEAIMSAIGVTNWFFQKPDSNTNLILGKFPQEFISEVRKQIPGAFFALFSKLPHSDPHDHLQILADESSLHGHYIMQLYDPKNSPRKPLHGSLLPFSEMGHEYFRISQSRQRSSQMDTHHSVKSWEISNSGKVKLSQACILSSSVLDNIIKSPAVLPCFFWGFTYRTRGGKKDKMRRVDMHEWTAARKSEIHMVVVMHGPCQQPTLTKDPGASEQVSFRANKDDERIMLSEMGHAVQGIVVRCIKEDTKRTAEKAGRIRGTDGKPQKLVKIGNFYASCVEKIILPEIQRVSWEIL